MTITSSRINHIVFRCSLGVLLAAAPVAPAFADNASPPPPAAQDASAPAKPDPALPADPAAKSESSGKSDKSGKSENPSNPVKSPAASTAPSASKSVQQNGTSAVVMDLSSIEGVIGHGVKSSAGEDMGRIVDLLVTMSGQVRAAVIDFGGILGVGSRKVAVDWRALDFNELPKGGDIRLLLTRNQVRVSPEYKSGEPVVILEASKPTESAPKTPPSSTADGAKPVPSNGAGAGGEPKPADAKPSEAAPAPSKQDPAAKAQ